MGLQHSPEETKPGRNDERNNARREAETRRKGERNPWKMEIVLDAARKTISDRGKLPRRHRSDRRKGEWLEP